MTKECTILAVSYGVDTHFGGQPSHPSTQAHPSRRVRYNIEITNIKNNDNNMPPFTYTPKIKKNLDPPFITCIYCLIVMVFHMALLLVC